MKVIIWNAAEFSVEKISYIFRKRGASNDQAQMP